MDNTEKWQVSFNASFTTLCVLAGLFCLGTLLWVVPKVAILLLITVVALGIQTVAYRYLIFK